MESIKQILMRRDKLTSDDAESVIDNARTALYDYITEGDMENAENICEEYFGLESDYLLELM